MNSPFAWVLVVHITGFIFWMTGLLAGTMVMAAHAQEASAEARQALSAVEKRLLGGLAMPGAILTIVAGVVMLWIQPEYLREAWLHFKLFLVVIMLVVHVVIATRDAAFRAGTIELQRRECMALHGAVSLLLLGIVILVLVKPF